MDTTRNGCLAMCHQRPSYSCGAVGHFVFRNASDGTLGMEI
jgi:hypothetical protein